MGLALPIAHMLNSRVLAWTLWVFLRHAATRSNLLSKSVTSTGSTLRHGVSRPCELSAHAQCREDSSPFRLNGADRRSDTPGKVMCTAHLAFLAFTRASAICGFPSYTPRSFDGARGALFNHAKRLPAETCRLARRLKRQYKDLEHCPPYTPPKSVWFPRSCMVPEFCGHSLLLQFLCFLAGSKCLFGSNNST